MNQFKNGTLLVVIATIVTAVLILMTDPETPAPSTDKDIAITENEASQLNIVTTDVEEKQQIEKVAVDVPKSEVKPDVDIVQIAAPKGPFDKTKTVADELINIEAETVIATSNQHEVLNHIIQPIWMDQKLGDFKSVEKGESLFKMMPTSPDGLQGENPKQVITSKSDKFAPTTVSAKYNYQQMPMYNGGYYIAPMPSYLMPSMLPGNAILENKKQN